MEYSGIGNWVIGLVVLCGIGLGALVAASSVAFSVIKWLGVVYLCFLGVQHWRAEPEPIQLDDVMTTKNNSRWQLYWQGILVNLTNPKGIIFMLAVLPQFIDPRAPQFIQYAICAATLTFTDLVVMSGYMGFAAKVLRLLRQPEQIKWLNRTFGSLFIAAGGALAVFKRTA